ncbi:non-hydrolyzing UDP-N-acetylglucosamine 2-epimerase [Caulobacter sp. 17J80-11]|uniref:non-hydrolyzing UDP-N-acetylglucosamine 2-epimerase n=1 Tax=Caulobacter sp. 17J80-11 TaxID=2763502 RepID=UPI001653A228|nr:UDP-N-acetylglucosamine 2-epimerase (non-hydrolyzing) [Caulobacter sp. 17J80-11]MBC6981696.1 UDP-N-acetylglucosamine 2-epimerase (non-hydrolyzing) [Caulobacter sp. 17J80-11]
MKVAVVFGTRPEAIKMAPVVRRLQQTAGVETRVWSTGQHREMLDQVLELFDLKVDVDLEVMRPDQTLNGLFARVLEHVDATLAAETPDFLLVHGDTTTAAAAATAAFHRRVRIGHVEAGLRSGRIDQPWPEEFNRRVVDVVADQLYAPTERARRNLLAENLGEKAILVTGNTVVDALLLTVGRLATDPAVAARLAERFAFLNPTKQLVLVTGHRRESFGEGFRNICRALASLADRPDVEIVYPVHLNPNVRGPVRELLSARSNVHLIEPVDYEAFVYLMTRCRVILTDSGGVQEEAPSLGKPVLVMRDVTERPEAVEAGVARLVGTRPDAIVEGVAAALESDAHPAAANPYGDGRAAERIVEGILACRP